MSTLLFTRNRVGGTSLTDFFEGVFTGQDKLACAHNVIQGKRLEAETLRQRAMNTAREQSAKAPGLKTALLHACLGAHTLPLG